MKAKMNLDGSMELDGEPSELLVFMQERKDGKKETKAKTPKVKKAKPEKKKKTLRQILGTSAWGYVRKKQKGGMPLEDIRKDLAEKLDKETDFSERKKKQTLGTLFSPSSLKAMGVEQKPRNPLEGLVH